MSSATGFPVAPTPQPVNVSSSSFSYYGTTKAAGGLLIALVVGLFTGVVTVGGYLVRALGWLLAAIVSVATWPLAKLFVLLRFLLSPVTYTLSYVFAPLVSFVSFLGRLRPLYTYLGSAAFIGIVTGLVLKFASSYFFVVLRLDADANAESDDGHGHEEDVDKALARSRPLSQTRRPARQLHDKARATLPLPTSAATITPAVIVKTEDSITPHDDVWQWLEEYNPNQPVVASQVDGGGSDTAAALLRKQIPGPGGLLSLTIMEESSSE